MFVFADVIYLFGGCLHTWLNMFSCSGMTFDMTSRSAAVFMPILEPFECVGICPLANFHYFHPPDYFEREDGPLEKVMAL